MAARTRIAEISETPRQELIRVVDYTLILLKRYGISARASVQSACGNAQKREKKDVNVYTAQILFSIILCRGVTHFKRNINFFLFERFLTKCFKQKFDN